MKLDNFIIENIRTIEIYFYISFYSRERTGQIPLTTFRLETPEEGRRTYRPKCYKYNNEGEVSLRCNG